MDTHAARLGWSGPGETDGGGTTTLVVGVIVGLGTARDGLLADVSAGHIVMSLNVDVDISGDLEARNRGLGGAGEGRTTADTDRASNALAGGRVATASSDTDTSTEASTGAETKATAAAPALAPQTRGSALASPARPGLAEVDTEASADGEVTEVVTTLLVGRAVTVLVVRR